MKEQIRAAVEILGVVAFVLIQIFFILNLVGGESVAGAFELVAFMVFIVLIIIEYFLREIEYVYLINYHFNGGSGRTLLKTAEKLNSDLEIINVERELADRYPEFESINIRSFQLLSKKRLND